jgi:hypothetical protein
MISTMFFEFGIVIAALAWKGQRLRDPHTRRFIPISGIRWTMVLAFVAVSLSLEQLIPDTDAPGEWLTYLAEYLHDVAVIAIFVALQVLYLGYQPEKGRWWSGRTEVRAAGSVLLVVAGITFWAAVTQSPIRFNQENLRRPVIAAFYLVPTVYILYAEISQVAYGVYYAIRHRSWVRSSALLLAATGMALLFVATAMRGWLMVAGVAGGPFSVKSQHIASTLITVGNIIVAAGLVLPVPAAGALAASRRWRARRLYKLLEPLWWLVRYAFPELIRPAAPTENTGAAGDTGGGPSSESPRRELDRKPTPEFLATGRRTECRGGYQMLQPYLSGAEAVPDIRVEKAVAELAATLPRRVPQLSTYGSAPDSRAAWRADTRQLVAVSRALRTRDLSWCNPASDTQTANGELV